MTATVEAVDLEQRRLTLKGPQGTARTFTVDERVERFNEIKVGDEVKMDYYLSFASEIREPTAEEKASPSTVLERTAKALPGTAPPAGGLRRIKAVVTVEQIDRPAERVTVRGPLGNTLTVRVADPSRLDMVHLGDTVIVTYTEGLAVAVEKVE
jgi:hypothetical protein